MNSTTEQQTKGVEKLLARIRDEGVAAARQEADRILDEAREEAAALRARARNEATAIVDNARSQVKVEQDAGQEALRLAARDTLLELRVTIRRGLEDFVSRLVTRESCDVGFVRNLILALAGQLADTQLKDQDMRIFVGTDLLKSAEMDESEEDNPLSQELLCRTLELSGEMLREGIQLISSSDFKGGARVRLVGENLEFDLSDEAISRLLRRFLLPRFRHIVEDVSEE